MVASRAGWGTTVSEHYQMVYFCALRCRESAPEAFRSEDRSDTNEIEHMIPST